MPRPRSYPDDVPAARMRRSRARLTARGGQLVQVKLDPAAKRALAALALGSPTATQSELAASSLAGEAARRRFPLQLSRAEAVHVASLALGPFTPKAFRATGFADEFLAGVALAFATDREVPRDRLLALARTLAPAVVSERGYRRWLAASPISLARLFKLADTERAIQRARTPTLVAA
ncbi:MAG: hypothetical protein ABIU95_06160 [Burkholderiales bacterium]